MFKKILILIILIFSGALGFMLSWYLHPNSSTEEPSLSSDIQIIKTFHTPNTFVKQLKGDPDAGRKIFIEFCSACHAKEPLIDIQAPRIGDKKVWGALSQLGMPTLLKFTVKGIKAMPARGGCFECSDKQLEETIQYILKMSK